MKIVIFDVGNGSSALAVCPNGYSMLIDCGGSDDKLSPIDQIVNYKDSLGMRSFNGKDLTLLHITHPDNDHVNHSKRIMDVMPPYLLHRRRHEDFSVDQHVHPDYKSLLDIKYRGTPVQFNGWGFDQNKTFQIPMNVVKTNPLLSSKEKNNSSILRYLSCNGVRVLFGGDMETPGWDWLAANDKDFQDTMRSGIDVLIAPHHGHHSGFPQSLFNLTGKVMMTVHSKATEEDRITNGTDVSNRYGENTTGINYNPSTDSILRSGKILTTRSNGNIVITTEAPGFFKVFTDKPSTRHKLVLNT